MADLLKKLFTNLKIAFKSALYNYKQYVSFFAALFLIQCFFGMLTLSSDTNRAVTKEIISSKYDYDLLLLDLNYDQMFFLENDEIEVFVTDHVFDIVRIKERVSTIDGNTTYDVYINVNNEDKEEGASLFLRKYLGYLQKYADIDKDVTVKYSEIYKLQSYDSAAMTSYYIFASIMTVVSIILITSIYRIRVNHYKFTYGIYMSFGANFKKLVNNSFWEMTAISLMTFIPSQLFSLFIVYLIYAQNGVTCSFGLSAFIKVFIINLIIVVISVCFPMWRISKDMPCRLLQSYDNSNLVTSPRHSFDFFKFTFPKKIELASMWRFRRYISVMLITAVSFAAIFVSGLYIADYYKYTLEFSKPQFTAKLINEAAYDEWLVPDLEQIDVVYKLGAYSSMGAPSARSHVLLPKKSLRVSASLISATPENYPEYSAVNKVNYVLANNANIDLITSELFDYKIEGDPHKVLTSPGYAVVTNYIGNKRIADFKVGDTILVGAYNGRTVEVDFNLTGMARLRQELRYYRMNYISLEVCAVIDGVDTLSGAPIYLNSEVYTKICGTETPVINTLDIYMKPGTTIEEATEAFDVLRNYTSYYTDNLELIDNNAVANYKISSSLNYYQLFIAISLLILAISPLIWFFSQTLFIKKREKEFSVLIWLGGIKKDIRKLSIFNGIILSLLSAVLCIVVSIVSITLIQMAITQIPPALYGSTQSYYFDIYIPLSALILSTVISMLSGYLSSTLPTNSFLKVFDNYTASEEFSDSKAE